MEIGVSGRLSIYMVQDRDSILGMDDMVYVRFPPYRYIGSFVAANASTPTLWVLTGLPSKTQKPHQPICRLYAG